MRKLLLTLCAASGFSLACANQIDIGKYEGYLQQNGYGQDGASGVSTDGSNVDITIPTLSALDATDGHLTGTLNSNVNSANPNTNCIDNASFSAKKGTVNIRATSITLTNCAYQNGVLSGKYDAVVLGIFHNKGVFQFTYIGN
jgi:hypothetical protein